MKIALINLEPKYTNIALGKIRMYHKLQGDQVVDETVPIPPLIQNLYDRIYVSSIFSFTDKSLVPKGKNVIYGGSGFDLRKKLPPEIECMKPKINYGFTTRGCIRKCKFCGVPIKEGLIHAVGDIYDLWDGKSNEITLLDNNILALPDHFFMICDQVRKEKLKVDFNQGLDIRLLEEEHVKVLAKMRHIQYKFAFDHPRIEKMVRQKVELLKRYGINQSSFYVLVGFDTTFEQDLHRLRVLKELGQRAYVMRYIPITEEEKANYVPKTKEETKVYTAIASWANNRTFYGAMSFDDFLDTQRGSRYKQYVQLLNIA